MPKVYNKHHKDAPPDAVYVGRPSKWGNPFVIGDDGTREQVINKYREYIENVQLNEPQEFEQDYIIPLKGKDLVCWCAPKPCHADVLLELANA